jgi:predicted SAM-dependent methyltransferase
MKIHLGCGERYFKGYLNVDYPPSEHTVQATTVADEYADLKELSYAHGTIAEVRLHHVFEHFPRPTAFALLANWNRWLQIGGVLRIEVPDLAKCAKDILNPLNRHKFVTIRHLFGSHEAHWAIHCEGWTQNTLKKVLASFGFSEFKFKRNSWRGTHNLDVACIKISDVGNDAEKIAEKLFQLYLLDQSETEQKLLSSWISEFSKCHSPQHSK